MNNKSHYLNHVPDICVVVFGGLTFLIAYIVPDSKIIPVSIANIGWIFVFGGILLSVQAIYQLKKYQTSTNPIDIPSKMITTGVFAFSRNPLYLAYSMFIFGCALISASYIPFIAPIIYFLIINLMIIPLEERNMQKKFGSKYETYIRKTRRWI